MTDKMQSQPGQQPANPRQIAEDSPSFQFLERIRYNSPRVHDENPRRPAADLASGTRVGASEADLYSRYKIW
jgi:hypothetical protein